MIIVNKFHERFNIDLTDNILGLVFLRKYHMGFDINKNNASITLQGFDRVIVFTLCFSKKRYKYLKDER